MKNDLQFNRRLLINIATGIAESGFVTDDEQEARELVEVSRWGFEPACVHCGAKKPYPIKPNEKSKTRKGLWKCKACRKQFTVTVGTIFEDSHLSLAAWLKIIYLFCFSAWTHQKRKLYLLEIHQKTGIKYSTIWSAVKRIESVLSRDEMIALGHTAVLLEDYRGQSVRQEANE
jgi:transposase-like protein